MRDAMVDCKLHQRKLWRYHSDQGTEFAGECERWLKECGFVLTDTGGYRPAANGIAERRIKELFGITRALLLQAHAPKELWGEALRHANELFNNTPRQVRGNSEKVTPQALEQPSEKQPDVTTWPVWGCRCMYLVPKSKRPDKLSPLCEEGIFVGFDHRTVMVTA